jgi:uncharacterized protein
MHATETMNGASETIGSLLAACIGDPEAFICAIVDQSLGGSSSIHGENHWRAVAWAGVSIASATPRADFIVVFLFAVLHDAARVNDGDDPEHGVRAAAMVARLEREGLLRLTADSRRVLASACRLHADGYTTHDPTIGACWDADRIDLWRLGIPPDAAMMSTTEGRRRARVEPTDARFAEAPWKALLERRVESARSSGS